MADYGKLLSRIWSDPEFIALDARPQQVYALLISYSTRNLAGVLPLTLKRWAGSTHDATVDNIAEALKALVANRFVVVDWDSEEVLIRTYIRNDEVYKQPNLMKAARRCAGQTGSAALRWALYDELTRLPAHKDADDTLAVANSLVEGLDRTLSEGLPEPFDEPMPEGSGVGGYLSGVREHQHPHPSPAPTPAAAAIPEPHDAASATSGAELVRTIIPREHPDSVKSMLRIRASELLNTGTPPPDVAEALRLWLTKPSLGPNVLPSLVSEVIKARTAPNGKPHKMRTALELAAELRAEEQAQLESVSQRRAIE